MKPVLQQKVAGAQGSLVGEARMLQNTSCWTGTDFDYNIAQVHLPRYRSDR